MNTTMLHNMTICNLGSINRIPHGEGRVFQIGNIAVAVFRSRNGEIFATQSTCPHKNGPLADGLIGAGTVICPLHAYAFNLATGQPIGHTCPALKTYPVSLSETGDILLKLDVAI
jgi:nitrite reductase (NADH) small subunit